MDGRVIINKDWEKDEDIDVGDYAYIVPFLTSVHIHSVDDAWTPIVIKYGDIFILRDELDNIIKRLT